MNRYDREYPGKSYNRIYREHVEKRRALTSALLNYPFIQDHRYTWEYYRVVASSRKECFLCHEVDIPKWNKSLLKARYRGFLLTWRELPPSPLPE